LLPSGVVVAVEVVMIVRMIWARVKLSADRRVWLLLQTSYV